MCGRAYETYTAEELAFAYLNRRPLTFAVGPNYNLAPTQVSPVVLMRDGVRDVELSRWGLIPFWAKSLADAGKYSLINARGEEIAEKRSYAKAFRERRCVVPLSGFYEWRKDAQGVKHPMAIYRADGAPMSVAGVWSTWQGDGAADPVPSFSIVTTRANTFMEPIHDRMPVVLDDRDLELWLDPEVQEPERVLPLVRPCPPAWLAAHEVSRAVNSVKNNRPGLLAAI